MLGYYTNNENIMCTKRTETVYRVRLWVHNMQVICTGCIRKVFHLIQYYYVRYYVNYLYDWILVRIMKICIRDVPKLYTGSV